MQESEDYIMDKLTAKQKDKMYDEIGELLFKYDKDRTAKRMIKSFFSRSTRSSNFKRALQYANRISITQASS